MVLKRERRDLERLRDGISDVPQSASELQSLLCQEFVGLALDSAEFGSLMRKLVPEIHVYNVRLFDGGPPLPRARVRIALDGTFPDTRHLIPGLSALLTRIVTIDLFETPRREKIRQDVVRLAAAGLSLSTIASQITGTPSPHTVRSALELEAILKSNGHCSPYIFLNSPPDDYVKLRRHRGPKYQFTPVAGYEPPSLSSE